MPTSILNRPMNRFALSPLTSSQPQEKHAERESTQNAAYRMQATPPNQQSGCIWTARVKGRVEQSIVRWQYRAEGERDHRTQTHRGDGRRKIPQYPCRPQTRRAARDRERRLHDRGAPIAGPEFPERHLVTAREACWMLDRVDVDGGTGKQACTRSGNR
jgi:hypothetical protein